MQYAGVNRLAEAAKCMSSHVSFSLIQAEANGPDKKANTVVSGGSSSQHLHVYSEQHGRPIQAVTNGITGRPKIDKPR